MISKRPRLFIFVDYYKPGFAGGGPRVSIENVATNFSGKYRIYIVTQAYDFRDRYPYKGLLNRWKRLDGAAVYYAPRGIARVFQYIILLKRIRPKLIWLNSFFSPISTIPIILLRSLLLSTSSLPTIAISPRGEFYSGALLTSYIKKSIWLFLFKCITYFRLRNLIWAVSNEQEASSLIDLFTRPITTSRRTPNSPDFFACLSCKSPFIFEVPDISSLPNISPESPLISHPDTNSSIAQTTKLVFLSRVCPKKNLLFAIRALANVHSFVEFDVYGPIEDQAYWDKCLVAVSLLPSNIKFNYKGAIHPNDVVSVFTNYHLFLFPTLGENFGHVIIEALSASLPVLISDNTPWAYKHTSGFCALSLNNLSTWSTYIDKFCSDRLTDPLESRSSASLVFQHFVISSDSVSKTEKFLGAVCK